MRDSVDAHVELWKEELPWLDPVQEAIVARIGKLARHHDRLRREALAESDLKRWQFKLLLMLRRLGPPYEASPSELAEHLALTRGALSHRLGPLEAGGLITRTTDKADRRRVHVRLTAKGSAELERHLEVEGTAEGDLVSVLSPRERARLANLLRKLLHAAETSVPAEGPHP